PRGVLGAVSRSRSRRRLGPGDGPRGGLLRRGVWWTAMALARGGAERVVVDAAPSGLLPVPGGAFDGAPGPLLARADSRGPAGGFLLVVGHTGPVAVVP